MGKPVGIDAAFRVHMPTRTEDKIWEAVQEARIEGFTLSRLIAEVKDAWVGVVEEDVRNAKDEVRRSTD